MADSYAAALAAARPFREWTPAERCPKFPLMGDGQWVVGPLDNRPFCGSGYLLVEGEPPVGEPTRQAPVHLSTLLTTAPIFEQKPVAFGQDDIFSGVKVFFGDASMVPVEQYDIVTRRFPGARFFFAEDSTATIVVRPADDERIVAVIAPIVRTNFSNDVADHFAPAGEEARP